MSGGVLADTPRSRGGVRPGGQEGCHGVVLDAVQLRDLDPGQWDALAGNGIEANPFLSRAFVMAGIDALGDAQGLNALAFRLQRDGRLVGLIPFRRERFGGIRLSHARTALNLYQVGGVPLIDRDHADAVAAHFLDLPCARRDTPSRWVLPHLDLDGPFARLLGRHATGRGFPVERLETYSRPLLTRLPEGFETHLETVVGKKRVKDIQRNLRRLGELGAVPFERATDPETVALRLEQFLAIEQAGWKGR